ncbi:hypothetical protein NJB1728e24_11330 [Mycobacterium marinum]|nr:hypothetical protein NJB1728e24_11330 [Mycobacterium marinum]
MPNSEAMAADTSSAAAGSTLVVEAAAAVLTASIAVPIFARSAAAAVNICGSTTVNDM